MKSFSSLPFQSICTTALVCVCALAMSGCSGSSDSVSSDNQQAVIDSAATVGSNDSDNNVSNEAPAVAESDTVNEVANNEEPASDLEIPDSNNPVVVDPLIQNLVLVSFDISVPAYQSDELRLELVWGDINLTAGWQGDEFWTVSSEFPTEAEELLIVTFFDSNGAIELASFSQQFRTGSNATEAFQISADQFDTGQFDDDGDGVSNLDELVAGNDPTVDENSLLEIRDFIGVNTVGISVTASLESQLPEEPPISITTQEQVTQSDTIDIDIQIDSDGNGTFARHRVFNCESDRLSGIRTRVGNAITWEAARIENDCDFTRDIDLTNTVTIVDDNTRTYVEEGNYIRTGSFTTTYLTSTNLIGELVEETTLCEPVAGTFSQTFTSNNNGQRIIITFVSKEINDRYWRVEVERRERVVFSRPLSIEDYDVTISEYFVRELNFGGGVFDESPELFICDFVDI